MAHHAHVSKIAFFALALTLGALLAACGDDDPTPTVAPTSTLALAAPPTPTPELTLVHRKRVVTPPPTTPELSAGDWTCRGRPSLVFDYALGAQKGAEFGEAITRLQALGIGNLTNGVQMTLSLLGESAKVHATASVDQQPFNYNYVISPTDCKIHVTTFVQENSITKKMMEGSRSIATDVRLQQWRRKHSNEI
jgi:hypothetical protein